MARSLLSARLTRLLVGADGDRSVVRNKTVRDGLPLCTGTLTKRDILPRLNSWGVVFGATIAVLFYRSLSISSYNE